MGEQHDAVDRIEAALDRMEERLAHAPPPALPEPVPSQPAAGDAALAARLDQLIAQLRAALDEAEA